MKPPTPTSMNSSPPETRETRDEYLTPDGRTFGKLNPQEQLALVNGPRISGFYVVLAVILWVAFLGFLTALALPYMA